jgi:hypothetical protein
MQKMPKRRIRNREQVGKALDLRAAGGSYDSIGKALGLSKTRAYQLVQEGLDELNEKVRETAESVRSLELRRLDAMFLALYPQRAQVRATDSLLRIMERRAKLLGLDAPTKVAQTNPDGSEALPPEIRVVLVKPAPADAD